MTREFVGRVPAGTQEKLIEMSLEWDEMTLNHVDTWHTHIQPHISANKIRADQKWDWPFFFHFLIPLHTLRGHRPKAYAAMAYSRHGEAVPIGMLFMLTSYPRVDGDGKRAIFTYFLTTAPKNALEQLQVDRIPDLGRYLIDCGLVLSVNNEMCGHYWLHSAKKGKEWLVSYYLNECKLKQFPASKLLPKGVLPANDGRFFYSDEQHSKSLLEEFDKLRGNK